jgi:ribosomal protein S18 acetylase RimI-like enzyme
VAARVPPAVSTVPASRYDAAGLAALFTAAYEGYWFPLRLDAAAFEQLAATLDLDLEASSVAVTEDGRPVGLALLGLRGREGWVGGTGVVPERRRAGTGELLMRELLDRARARGLACVTLEVLEQNEPARRLYGRLGFGQTRLLEIWTFPGSEDDARDAEEADLDEALSVLAAVRGAPEPWQRAPATVARYREADDRTRALVHGDGAIVYRVADGRATVLQLAATDADAARELLAAALAGTSGGAFLNVPDDDPLRPALEALGGSVAARQLELELEL